MEENEKTKLYENLKQEIRSLLISSPKTKYGGLTGSILYFDYKEFNSGKEIPYLQLGFHSFLSFLRSMPDVVTIEYKANNSSYRVHPVSDRSTEHIQKMVLQQRDKYKKQHQVFNQNWHSNQYSRNNLSNSTNIRKYFPRRVSNNTNRNQLNCLTLIEDENEISIDLSPKHIDHNQTNSTLKTFRETPDIQQNSFEKNENHVNKIVNEKETCFLSSSSCNSSIVDEYSPKICKTLTKSKLKIDEEKERINRLNEAIIVCIQFRYIHRLCQLEFVYRHYPSSNEIQQIKIEFQQKAFIQYEKQLNDFQENLRQNCLFNYADFFDEYIYLKRNYHYMNKFINKTKQ